MNAPSSSTQAIAAGMADAIVQSVEQFADREIDARRIDAQHCIDESVLQGLRSLGVFGLTLPEKFGGSGADLLLATRVVAALAERDRSVATTVGLHLGLGTRAFVESASRELAAEFGPALASGECIAAFATTEPRSGSDLSKLSTRVMPVNGGYRLNGEKSYVTNGGIAGLVTVTAHSEGAAELDRGMALLAVPVSRRGVARQREEIKLGLRGSSTTGYTFDDVSLSGEYLLAPPPGGKAMLERVLSWGRTLMSAGCVGAATTAWRRSWEHVNLRRQFGHTLAEQPVVRARLARGKALLFAMKNLVEHAAEQPAGEALHRWSVSAKIFSSEQAGEMVDTALQLHGGSGFIEDSGLPLLYRDVRITRIFEGANDVLLTHAGSLELMAKGPSPHTPACAEEVVARVASFAQRLHREFGVRVFRRADLLHRLGVGVVWRDALLASAQARSKAPELSLFARLAMAAIDTAELQAIDPDEAAQILELNSLQGAAA